MSEGLVLLRTHVYAERERAIISALKRWGKMAVAVAADDTSRPLRVDDCDKIGITRAAAKRLGLFCPKDFAWRNGDYAFYIAREKFPEMTHIWMIEPDVEHSFSGIGDLFDRFEVRPDIDLLATGLRPAEDDWWWRQTMPRRSTGTWRCLFATIRLSAPAIDACRASRARRTWSVRDRLEWPNDEVFVATEVHAQGLKAADLNAVGPRVYEDDSFGYDPLEGTASFRSEKDRIFHPVLYGADYQRRLERHATAQATMAVRLRRRAQRALR